MLAKTFLQPANLLVMDEPTNDLDVDTLELLEELLLEFDGTLLLVSHDRTFLDNVVTSTLVFEGDGKIGEYVGGYEDWLRQSKNAAHSDNVKAPATLSASDVTKQTQKKKKKLSYKEQNELDQLPVQIETLEEEKEQLQQKMNEPDFYQQEKPLIKTILDKIEAIEAELQVAYARWELLDQD
jgi:ATP-binding cassette subfamily F protein uup